LKTKANILSLLFLAVFFGCKKDHNILSVDAQPESDVLGASFSDTAKVFAHTISYDSAASFNDRFKFLGSNQDPVFGRTDVGLYLNSSIPGNISGVNFGDDANLISAEIILEVASLDFVGDYKTTLTYSVFPISNALDKNKVYFTHNASQHNKNSVLGSYTGTFSTLNEKLVLRIPIDNNYAKAILNNPQFLTDNSTFQNTYKGFYISTAASALNPASAQGAIAKLNLDDELSGFYLYYQNGTPSATKETKSVRFIFSGADAARYNTVNYQPGSGGNNLLYDQLVMKDSTKGKENLFLKGLGGTKLKIHIPSLKNYADSFTIAVNRAEVVLNVDPSFVSTIGQYSAPPLLSLLPLSSDGQETYALDQLNDLDRSRYNGEYDYDNNRYVFNIARHVQAIMRGTQTNYGFYVVVANPSPIYTSRRDNYAERIVLAGSNHATLKPKFNLSFIKLKHDK
jgi:hypothetical protein